MATGTDRQRGIGLGSVLGTPVLLMPSWFLIAVLITLSYAPAVQTRLPEVGVATFVIAFLAALLLLGSVFLHELAHAIAARAVGSAPSRIVLDLWGGHTAFDAEMVSPGKSALVSLVGPGTNAAIAALGWLMLPAVPPDGVAELLLFGVIYSNGFVAVFNALPGLPLDGGRALEALIWKVTGDRGSGTLAAGWVGRAVALGLVLWTLVRPLALGRTPGLTTTVWVLVVAWMLWQGATGALAVARWRRRALSVTVRAFTRPAIGVPAGAPVTEMLSLAGADGAEAVVLFAADGAALAEALSLAGAGGAEAVVLIAADGAPLAVLDPDAIAALPAGRLEPTPAQVVARLLPADATVPQDLAGEQLIVHLQNRGHHEFVVLDGSGAVAGLLLAQDVAASLEARRG